MGTGWSKLSVEEMNVHGEQELGGKQTLGDAHYFSSRFAEVSVSADQSTQTSEEATTTKASSSSIPVFQTVDECGIAVGGEIELSEFEGGGELEKHDDDDGFDDPVSKPHSLTMLDPTSPPIKAFLKLQEIEQLNKSRRHHPETVSLQSSKPHQVLSPMAGAKSRAFTGNLEESKLGHKEEVLQEFLLLPGVCLQSSSQLSLLPLPRFELNHTREKTSNTTQQEQHNDNNNNNPSSSTRFQFSDPFEPSTDPNNNPQLNALPPVIKSSVLPEGTKIGSSMESSFGNFSQQPFTSAQKLLLFDLNRKRKLAATQSLVSLVGDYLGAASTNELKNPPHPPPPPHTSSLLERLIPWSLSLPLTK
ncbi:unnamed protein product [Sphagnum troendelagicum]|uniref:Uncharacterized protein n=1 Tax=Sphagnum troendelagicum TaxID=128251 RepID=A0ABP0U3H0_9BRYO